MTKHVTINDPIQATPADNLLNTVKSKGKATTPARRKRHPRSRRKPLEEQRTAQKAVLMTQDKLSKVKALAQLKGTSANNIINLAIDKYLKSEAKRAADKAQSLASKLKE